MRKIPAKSSSTWAGTQKRSEIIHPSRFDSKDARTACHRCGTEEPRLAEPVEDEARLAWMPTTSPTAAEILRVGLLKGHGLRAGIGNSSEQKAGLARHQGNGCRYGKFEIDGQRYCV